jgi:hypothetical protein
MKQKKRRKLNCSLLAAIGTIRVSETEIPLLTVLVSVPSRNAEVHEFGEGVRLNLQLHVVKNCQCEIKSGEKKLPCNRICYPSVA